MQNGTKIRIGCTLAVLLATIAAPALAQTPAGTGFTYQGKLNLSGSPLNDTADLRFTLWDAETGGNQISVGYGFEGRTIVDGLFTVDLDFGVDAFNGEARWLEIVVRSPAGGGAYTTLSPRQPLTAAPLALALRGLRTIEAGDDPNYADSWNVLGGHPENSIDPNVGGAVIAGGGATSFPNMVTAPFGTISGGLFNSVNAPIATISGGSVNLASGISATISGGDNNTAGGERATIGGGTLNYANGERSSVGGGTLNSASAVYSVVDGGVQNEASGESSTVGGGELNTASGECATVGGGSNNTASASTSTVAGGLLNTADAESATVGGGVSNSATADDATVGGGAANSAEGVSATVSGGQLNVASAIKATIGGGNSNNASQDNSTIGGGSGNTIASPGGNGTIGGGVNNTIAGDTSLSNTIGGGEGNTSQGGGATVAGGTGNTASGLRSTVGGGYGNTASGENSVVAGGGGYYSGSLANAASGTNSTVPGGALNVAAGDYSFAAGLRAQANHSGTFVWADSTDADFASTAADQFLIRAAGGVGINKNDPNSALDVNGTVTATSFVGDGSGLTNITVAGDDLGNHTATQALDMATFDITNAGTVTASAFVGDGSGLTGISGGDPSYGSSAGSPNDAVYVDDLGRVGIGTTTPGQTFDVAGVIASGNPGTSPDGSALVLGSPSGDPGIIMVHGDGAGGETRRWDVRVDDDDSFRIFDHTASKECLVIDTAGEVGIGTTVPSEKLDVNGSARITGNLGIGATSPGEKFYVYGSARVTGDLTVNSTASFPGVLDAGSGTFKVYANDGVGVGEVPGNVDFNVRGDGENNIIINAAMSDGYNVFQVQADDEVYVIGDFNVINGSKNFILDHPLDPENENLAHNAVEGPGYYTFYQGRVVCDDAGEAWAELPDYFEALNTDFLYQLTCVGGFANVYVAEEVHYNGFLIAGGEPGLTVCWQVTATRNDPWAQDHPYQAVREKEAAQRGRLFYPQGYGYPEEMSIARMHEDARVLDDDARAFDEE